MPIEDLLRETSYVNRTPPRSGLVASLMSKINQWVRTRPASNIPRDLGPNTTETGASDAAYASFSDRLWRVRTDRRSVFNDLNEMDQNDPIVATALDVIADCVTGYEDVTEDGFDWTMEHPNPGAMKLLEDLKDRLNLGAECWQIVRGFVRNGEEFREVVVDEDTIVRFKQLPAWTMMPNFDEYGNKIPGWEQRLDNGLPGRVIEFQEWQVIAFVYGARRGWFGTGLMMPARRTWRRLQKMEDGMAIARMTRAYDKLVHHIPVKTEWDEVRQQRAVLNYKNNMTRRLGLDNDGNMVRREKPMEVETDFYIPDDGSNKGNIEILSAQNMQLMNIDDVEYHQALLLARVKVPRKMLNLGSGVKGALTDGGLSAEDIQFARRLRNDQAVLRAGILQLASLALIFQGYDPDQLGVGMKMARISTEDHLQNSKIQLNDGQAARFYADVMGGLPVELIADKFMSLTDEEKVILQKFSVEQEAKAEKAAKDAQDLAKQAAQQKPQPVAGPAAPARVRDAPKVQDVIDTVTRLQMMVQAELEGQGQTFGVGTEERRLRNLEVLADRVLDE